MNFGDLWQEHRRFITATVAGLVGVFIIKLVIGYVYNPRIERAQGVITRAQGEQARALPSGVNVNEVKKGRENLEAQFGKVRDALQRKPKAEMTLVGVADPDLHYNAQLDRIRSNLLELCALRNIDVDQKLGLPDAFPATRGEIEHYLRGLDAVEQLIAVCLAAESRFEAGVARIERIDIEKPSKARSGAAARAKPFVTTLTVEMAVIGHPRALDEVVRSFSAAPAEGDLAGRRLVLLEATLRSLDLGPGVVNRDRRGVDPLDARRCELRLKAAAMDVDSEGKI
jgi:hypothetical protein